jgi:hypothetical protein
MKRAHFTPLAHHSVVAVLPSKAFSVNAKEESTMTIEYWGSTHTGAVYVMGENGFLDHQVCDRLNVSGEPLRWKPVAPLIDLIRAEWTARLTHPKRTREVATP